MSVYWLIDIAALVTRYNANDLRIGCLDLPRLIAVRSCVIVRCCAEEWNTHSGVPRGVRGLEPPIDVVKFFVCILMTEYGKIPYFQPQILNKKAQLSLTNPRDAKACQNCSNSTCYNIVADNTGLSSCV